MADTSPSSQDFPSDHDPEPGDPSTLTGLFSAEYTCPKCNAVVVRIEGNNLQYLQNHVYPQQAVPDEDGYISLVMYHRDMSTPPDYVPTKALRKPFLTIKSSTMTS